MKRVVRWEYATKEDRSVEPLYFERNPKFSPGKKLAKLSSPAKYGNMAYGIDGEGRCVVERHYVLNDALMERFLAWSDDGLEWVLYDDRHQAQNVRRAVLEHGRIAAHPSQGEGLAQPGS
jgi:hypothetical protein